MQFNLNIKEDFTKPPFAREDEDKHCNIKQDQLWRWLEESNWGQDVDKWRNHFRLGPKSNIACCTNCDRPISHHHTDHSREYQQSDRFRTTCPITCGNVQSRLLRSKQGNAIAAQMMFITNPENGQEQCRACNYTIAQHPNGQDVADAMTNALGLGGLMQGLSGGQLGGDQRRTDITPQEQEWLDSQERITGLLRADRVPECPYSQEDWLRFEIDSCYQRYREIYSIYITQGQKKPNENITPEICTICREERKWHRRDNTMPEESEEEYWRPKAKKPCGAVQRYFENQRNGMVGNFLIGTNPFTNEEVCMKCKYRLSEHDDGPDQGEEMKNQIMGAFFGGAAGGNNNNNNNNNNQGGQQQQQGGANPFAMFGGGMMGGGKNQQGGGGGAANPFAMLGALQKLQRGGVQVNSNLQTTTHQGTQQQIATHQSGGMPPFQQQHQQQHQQAAYQQQPPPPPPPPGPTATAPSQQQHQASPPVTAHYQQFDNSAATDDGYIEVMQMEMCCGCFPRMVKKRVKAGNNNHGAPAGGMMMGGGFPMH